LASCRCSRCGRETRARSGCVCARV
jgi:hypothetical protein